MASMREKRAILEEDRHKNQQDCAMRIQKSTFDNCHDEDDFKRLRFCQERKTKARLDMLRNRQSTVGRGYTWGIVFVLCLTFEIGKCPVQGRGAVYHHHQQQRRNRHDTPSFLTGERTLTNKRVIYRRRKRRRAANVDPPNELNVTPSPNPRQTLSPTFHPSAAPPPTYAPTNAPVTVSPTGVPTRFPTNVPTFSPTLVPTTKSPTRAPSTLSPTQVPSWSPTTGRPSPAPTTRRPTGAPTTGPISTPTGMPIGTTAGSSSQPSSMPSGSPPTPSVPESTPTTLAPTNSNSPRQTFMPSLVPSAPPNGVDPNNPDLWPSPGATVVPSFAPSFTGFEPTNEILASREKRGEGRDDDEDGTSEPTLAPSPTAAVDRGGINLDGGTLAPTAIVWEPLNLTKVAHVALSIPENRAINEEAVASIWQDLLRVQLEEEFEHSSYVNVLNFLSVDLNVAQLQKSQERGGGASSSSQQSTRLRQRVLQADTTGGSTRKITTELEVTTVMDLEHNRNSESLTRDQAMERANRILGFLLQTDNLQSVVNDPDVEVTSVSFPRDTPVANVESGENDGKSKPSAVRIVFGFLLLGLTLGSLLFWGYILWRKRQKRAKQRRRDAARKANTYVMPPRPRVVTSIEVGEEDNDDSRGGGAGGGGGGGGGGSSSSSSDSSDDSSYKGMGSDDGGDGHARANNDDESDAVSDPFARELRQAASLDEAAWNEFQRRKEDLQRQGRVAASMYSTAAGAGEEGVEIQGLVGAGAFPYGSDSNSNSPTSPPSSASGAAPRSTVQSLRRTTPESAPSRRQTSPDPPISQQKEQTPPVTLSASDAVGWTAGGISQKMRGGGAGDSEEQRFEPYGDKSSSRKEKRKKGESLEENWDLEKTPIEEKPSRFSFLYPLRAKQEGREQLRASPPTVSSHEDSSNAAVRVSPSASSWSDAGTTTLRTSPTESMVPLGLAEDEKQQSLDESQTTMDMVKEVQRLSAYVKRYEERKVRRSDREGGNTTAGSVPSVPYDNMSDSVISPKPPSQVQQSRRPSRSPPAPQQRKKADAPGHKLGSRPPTSASDRNNRGWNTADDNSKENAASYLERINALSSTLQEQSSMSEQFTGMGTFESSSELTGTDSDTTDDESLRLGINRFSIQKPTPLLMSFGGPGAGNDTDTSGGSSRFPLLGSYQGGPNEVSLSVESSSAGEGSRRGHLATSQAQSSQATAGTSQLADLASDDEGRRRRVTVDKRQRSHNGNKHNSSGTRGSLDAMVRKNNVSLATGTISRSTPEEDQDYSHSEHAHSSAAPSDEFTREEKKDSMEIIGNGSNHTNSSHNSYQRHNFHKTSGHHGPGVVVPNNNNFASGQSPPTVRSRNQGFNSIVSMFESKPKVPIAPPNDTWQHSGLRTSQSPTPT